MNPNAKTKCGIFDFCETLTSIQTADNFILYYLINKWRLNSILRFIWIKKVKRYPNRKRIILNYIKGVSKKELEVVAIKYANFLYKYKRRKGVAQIFRNMVSQGYKMIVVSAGYDIYMHHFVAKLAPDIPVISNSFCYENGLFTGELTREDCYQEEKVNRIFELFPDLQIDFGASFTFSDSIEDRAIFELVRNKIFIDKDISPKQLGEDLRLF